MAKIEVTVSTTSNTLLTTDDLRVGQVGLLNETGWIGYVLRTFDALVLLNEPNTTWTNCRPRLKLTRIITPKSIHICE